MAQSHYLSFVAFCQHLKTFRKSFFRHYPRVVTSYGDTFWKSFEQRTVGEYRGICGYTMKDVVKILQTGSERLADSLMT